jgi:hypothetical protein
MIALLSITGASSFLASILCCAASVQDENGSPPAPPAATETDQADEPQEESTDSARTHTFSLPIESTLKPAAEIEGAPTGPEVFSGVLGRLGFEKFKALKTIGFKRGSIHWRGGRFTAYDSYYTKAFTSFPLRAKSSFTSNYDENDRLIPYFAVVNGEDRFQQRKLEVLATEAHEEDATDTVAQELGIVLAPFYFGKANSQATYLGKVTMKSHDPSKYDQDAGGYSGYAPVSREYDVISLPTPAPLARVFGPTVEMYVGPDFELAYMKARNTKRTVYYGQNAEIFYEYSETAEYDGIVIPTTIRAHFDFDAYRLETIMVSEVEPNVKITERELRRP